MENTLETINIEGTEFIMAQLKKLTRKSRKSSPMDEVYAYHGLTKKQFNKRHKNNPSYLKAYDKEVLIVAFYNKGDELDWSNSDEYKYYGYFVMNSDTFRLFDVNVRSENSNAPSALCFKRKSDAIEAYEKFFKEIKESRLGKL